jgi:hypothetical protein
MIGFHNKLKVCKKWAKIKIMAFFRVKINPEGKSDREFRLVTFISNTDNQH